MESNQPTKVIIVQSRKSMGIAILLTLLFGPLGMFYSTIAGAIVMMILTPIIGFITLGVGLLVMWPIQLIWTIIAISSHNKKNNALADQITEEGATPKSQLESAPKSTSSKAITKENIYHYKEANELSDNKIEELLLNESDLNENFIEALKFVRNERAEKRELITNRKSAFNNALAIDEQERKSRIASPTLYSTLSISALKYIQRCIECGIKPTENDFIVTFEEGYIATETPNERAERERRASEQAERERIRNEEKRQKEEAAALLAAKQKKSAIIIVLSIAIISIVCGIYCGLIAPNNEYNRQVAHCDTLYDSIVANSTQSDKEEELIRLKDAYMQIVIPRIGSTEKLAYISNKTISIDSLIKITRAEQEARAKEKEAIEKVAMEKATREREAKEKVEKEKAAREKAAKDAVAAREKAIRDEAIAKKRGFYSMASSPSDCRILNISIDQQYTIVEFEFTSGRTCNISISKNTYLQYNIGSESKKLTLKKRENIAISPQLTPYKLRGSGHKFYLYFDPIPEGVDRCDIVELREWKWLDIKLYIE